jgi:DNA-binding CsgD family transcriptional regulator
MDPTAVVRALEALMSPLAWGGQDAWLTESLKRVRQALDLPDVAVPVASIDELEALLRDPPFAVASEDSLPLMSMRCALASGLATIHLMHDWRVTLGRVCDDLNAGLAIFRHDGVREVARNTRWSELVDDEPERTRLLELIRRQLEYTTASAGSLREDYWELELSGRSYGVTAKCAPAGTLLAEAGVLVLMDRLGPELPTTRELRVSFGLRGREPQVALLAAEGLSNETIAQRLRLSPHTVRHYLERVLTRLGLHSRKALALHLMAGEREKPAAEENPPVSSR